MFVSPHRRRAPDARKYRIHRRMPPGKSAGGIRQKIPRRRRTNARRLCAKFTRRWKNTSSGRVFRRIVLILCNVKNSKSMAIHKIKISPVAIRYLAKKIAAASFRTTLGQQSEVLRFKAGQGASSSPVTTSRLCCTVFFTIQSTFPPRTRWMELLR